MPDAARELTPKQQRFVQEYLIDGNAFAAASRAGYRDPNKGRQLTLLPHVAAAIATAQAERSARTQVTTDDVVRGLHREATLTGKGSSHAARVAAWGHLARHLGMFVDRIQLGGSVALEVVEEIVDAADPATPPPDHPSAPGPA